MPCPAGRELPVLQIIALHALCRIVQDTAHGKEHTRLSEVPSLQHRELTPLHHARAHLHLLPVLQAGMLCHCQVHRLSKSGIIREHAYSEFENDVKVSVIAEERQVQAAAQGCQVLAERS